MALSAFDALSFVRKLKSGGFSQQQAESQAEAQTEVLTNLIEHHLVTRPYLDLKLMELRNDLEMKIKNVEVKVGEIQSNLIKRLVPLFIGQAGLMTWLMKVVVVPH